MSKVRELLERQDCLEPDEANVIAEAVQRDNPELISWLNDIIQCDGTNTEAKLAAILRGILLRFEKQQRGDI